MQQFEFVVGENGLLTEATAAEQAEWYLARCPDLEVLDVEADVMISRAYSALQTDAPFEHRGGLTRARYNILRMLHGDARQRKLMTDMVNIMNVSPTNITKLVDGLERDGYVRRVGSEEDKRKVWVELLASGAQVVEDTLPEVVQHITQVWQGLTVEEKRVLVHLLAKLRLDILTRNAGERVEGVCLSEPHRASA